MGAQGCLTKGASFDTVLPRLVSAYEQGQLVPFFGAGLSDPACRLWKPFVEELSQKAGIAFEAEDKPDAYVMQANKAIARLRALGPEAVAGTVRKALFTGETVPPPSTRALARLWWPIALTTNYDDCFVTAFREIHRTPVTVCGRHTDHSQLVLNALREPAEPLLWAIQGYLGGPCDQAPTDELAGEIVVGHEEYRRVAYAEANFRRAFAEVFRSRSLLFVGSGLQEPYFREMFSEILEIYGPCARPHYALVKRGSNLDIQFLATRFQTIVVEYDDHKEVPKLLDQLAKAVEVRAFREDRFSFVLREANMDDADTPCSRLTVVRGALKPPSDLDTCLAVSAGGSGDKFDFSKPIQGLLERAKVQGEPALEGRKYVARFDGQRVFAVRAREGEDLRALRTIRPASLELFETAWQHDFRHICMQILASGGSGSGPRGDDAQPFSALFSFVESVRAFGEWCRRHPDDHLELIIHLVYPSVAMEITRRRLDLQELLSSTDLRFWAKTIYPDRRVQRQMCQEKEDVTLGEIAEWLGMDVAQWQVQSFPQIGSGKEDEPTDLAAAKDEPLSHWVIPGGTLLFEAKRAVSEPWLISI